MYGSRGRFFTLQAAAFVAALGFGAAAHAESSVRLRLPGEIGGVDAATYDLDGNRVGGAELSVERLETGLVRMRSLSRIEGSGAQQEVHADLRPDDNGELQLLYQQSEARDEKGRSLGVMRIDHRRRIAQCGVAEFVDDEPEELKLPIRDRVVNVPLNLLFLPLVRGEEEEVHFQFLLCRGGPRVVDASASVADKRDSEGDAVEIRYEFDFGPLLSRLAAPFMPRLSFWFDKDDPGRWIGHSVPLYSKGPTVLVVRKGFDELLLDDLP